MLDSHQMTQSDRTDEIPALINASGGQVDWQTSDGWQMRLELAEQSARAGAREASFLVAIAGRHTSQRAELVRCLLEVDSRGNVLAVEPDIALSYGCAPDAPAELISGVANQLDRLRDEIVHRAPRIDPTPPLGALNTPAKRVQRLDDTPRHAGPG